MTSQADGYAIDLTTKIRVKILKTDIGPPVRQTGGAAGYDLQAAIATPITLSPGERKLFPCGFALELPAGFEAQIRPRSGLALAHGITVLNSPGTIDADYRGEIGVILHNASPAYYTVVPRARIAQMVIARVPTTQLVVAEYIGASARGEAGYGSTGT